jgi:hypothetical protein
MDLAALWRGMLAGTHSAFAATLLALVAFGAGLVVTLFVFRPVVALLSQHEPEKARKAR